MYVIIKKDKAERLAEKLHTIKSVICEAMECIDEARTKEYDREELYGREHTRRESYDRREKEYDREDDYDDGYYGREMTRGRSPMMRRGRY